MTPKIHRLLSVPLLLAATFVQYTSTSETEVSILDIYRYFPDTSFWDKRSFACSEQEQECFKENKLLYEADGKCHSVGGQGPCAEGEIFHADKAEALRKGGHLRGTCHKPCPGVDHAPLAATGECMARSEVEEKICREEFNLRVAVDTFGQWVCEWTTFPCPSHQSNTGPFYSTYDGICTPPYHFKTSVTSFENVTVPEYELPDHPLFKYIYNITLPKREFPCTEEERICLQYGRMLSKDGKCYAINDEIPECQPRLSSSFFLDWNEAMKGEGKLKVICHLSVEVKNVSCTPGSIRHPVRCRDSEEHSMEGESEINFESNGVRDKLCRHEWGLRRKMDVFGRSSCGCIASPPPPSPPPPAEKPGHCRLPDFFNPIKSPDYDKTLTLGFSLPCSEEEFACLRVGKVLMNGTCHTLRTRGPCAEGEELVLDKDALAHARLQPKCAPSPCSEGSVRMPIDGRCLTHQQATSLLCPSDNIALDEFGGWKCNYKVKWPANLNNIIRDYTSGICNLPAEFEHLFPIFPALSVGGNIGR